MENAWEGKIPKIGKFPRDECLLSTGIGTNMCLLSLFSQGQVALPSLSACGWTACAAVASSQRPVVQLRLVSSQKGWSCPFGLPSRRPQEQ